MQRHIWICRRRPVFSCENCTDTGLIRLTLFHYYIFEIDTHVISHLKHSAKTSFQGKPVRTVKGDTDSLRQEDRSSSGFKASNALSSLAVFGKRQTRPARNSRGTTEYPKWETDNILLAPPDGEYGLLCYFSVLIAKTLKSSYTRDNDSEGQSRCCVDGPSDQEEIEDPANPDRCCKPTDNRKGIKVTVLLLL